MKEIYLYLIKESKKGSILFLTLYIIIVFNFPKLLENFWVLILGVVIITLAAESIGDFFKKGFKYITIKYRRKQELNFALRQLKSLNLEEIEAIRSLDYQYSFFDCCDTISYIRDCGTTPLASEKYLVGIKRSAGTESFRESEAIRLILSMRLIEIEEFSRDVYNENSLYEYSLIIYKIKCSKSMRSKISKQLKLNTK